MPNQSLNDKGRADKGLPECSVAYMAELARDFNLHPEDIADCLEGTDMYFAYMMCREVDEDPKAKSPLQKSRLLHKLARSRKTGIYQKSTRVGPTGGPTVAPIRAERIPWRSNEEISRALFRIDDGGDAA